MEKKTQEPQEFWKSLSEWEGDPAHSEALNKEFMSTPMGEASGKEDGFARREFLKLMGASMALSSMACLRRPAETIVPYAKRPDEIVPGVSNYYTSTWVNEGVGYGLVVQTREGRPIKLEGNENHPSNRGALSARGQAHILSLYDPERLKGPIKTNRKGEQNTIDYEKLDDAIGAQLVKGDVAMLTSSLGSPSTNEIIRDFLYGFGGRHYVWDTLGADDVIQGQSDAYGKRVLPRFRFDKAKMILSIDADFLGAWLNSTTYSMDFSKGREPGKDMNRLISFESNVSLTGLNADSRIRIKPSQQLTVVMGLLNELIVKKRRTSYANNVTVKKLLENYSDVPQKIGMDPKLFEVIAQDLWSNRGNSLVVAGGLATRTEVSRQLQVAVNFLNHVLGNDGRTIESSIPVSSFEGSYSTIKRLIDDMNAGKVKTLIIHQSNPVYSLPKSFGFEEALKKVPMVISTSQSLDETAAMSDYVVPDHNAMENWGDAEVEEGVYSIQQPTISPMYKTRAFQESLMSWAYLMNKGSSKIQSPDSWHDYLKLRWRDRKGRLGVSGDINKSWNKLLEEGVVVKSQNRRNLNTSRRSFRDSSLRLLRRAPQETSGFELVLYPTSHIQSGDMANISWLQELPDPVTKIVWDNYLSVSIRSAKKLKVKDGDVVEVKTSEGSVRVPVYVQPGLHDEVVTLAVGFGRTHAGSVGNNIGKNAYNLVPQNEGQPQFSNLKVEIKKTGDFIELANTQGHHSMKGRQIVVEATLNDYMQKPSSGIHKHQIFSLWPKFEYKGHRWAMSIDQSSCFGCSACMVACQAENNIPTVGKKYVLEGREMHWIRIDRYYRGRPEDPNAVFQPMLCQHCENASCESVCPVAATTHNEEGINEMTYNRCVGTRYCSNNCPYKVRRFNWFNYAKKFKEPLNMQLNPDVTVRSRGVMEKCTFCTHRIKKAKSMAKDKGVPLKDGDVKVACEQACPSGAIVFGDVNDPKSRVAQLFKKDRSYSVLEEYNNIPMVRYMTKVRNADELKSSPKKKGGH